MRARSFIAAIAGLAALALPATAAFAQRGGTVGRGGEMRTLGPDRRDWTGTVERTPEGGFRMGNPEASVKLIEYVSLTCSHCAAFAHESGERLFLQYVRNGRVSVEYRNYYRDGADIAAAMLSRCASPREYFNVTHAILGAQPQWMGRINGLTPAQRAEISGLQPLQIAQRLVSLLGLDAIGARFGVTPAIRQACLNQAGLDQLETLHNAAVTQFAVNATPTFVVNGRSVGPQSWATLEPMLRGN